jgi:transcriptional regulator with XRE-family HTH domain
MQCDSVAAYLRSGEKQVPTPGQQLRILREQLGLTMRDVEVASTRIAAKHGNDDFSIALSRLSDIETKGIVPSIYRLYSLAVIYRRDFRELLSWYGVELNEAARDLHTTELRKSHRAEVLLSANAVRIPVRLDPAFDPRRSANLGRMIEQWGLVPMAYLAQFASRNYTYGYVGTEDFTMYPILLPGSFVQVDEARNKVVHSMWRSEFERPIYFVETRNGHTCCWCSLKGDQLTLQSHPLSPQSVRILRHPQEAEVIGQVVGVAMRLVDWNQSENATEPKARAALN